MNEVKNERKKWFLFVEKIMKLFIKKSNFVYLGEKITNGGIILSNHEGTKAPLALELYSGHPIRFWGTHEMNSGLKKMYAYQSKVFYHEKRHWNLFLARMFCLIASPLTNMFYKGLNLISTYQDARLRITLKESVEALNKGHNLVIYPEISDNGYLKELEGFHEGFDVLFDYGIIPYSNAIYSIFHHYLPKAFFSFILIAFGVYLVMGKKKDIDSEGEEKES